MLHQRFNLLFGNYCSIEPHLYKNFVTGTFLEVLHVVRHGCGLDEESSSQVTTLVFRMHDFSSVW